MKPTVLILAAGLGTRMKSGLAKALHPLAGRPLVAHALNAANGIGPERVVVIVGHQAEQVTAAVEAQGAEIVLQQEQLGTGHAVLQARQAIDRANGPVMILCADTPLLTSGTLRDLAELHVKTRSAITLITARVENPYGYGRVVRGSSGVMKVVEEKDATARQRKITEVNAGIYCFDRSFLSDALDRLDRNNAQGEYYLPDAIALARRKQRRVSALVCDDPREVLGVNTRKDLSVAEAVLRDRVNTAWMLAGVTLVDPDSTFIGSDVVLGRDTVLYGNVRIEGKSRIGERCTVYPGSRIADSVIGDRVTVKDCSIIEESEIESEAAVGPFAHLRPGAVISERARIGNFVEVKKSIIGKGSKANHLSYIGDATVGSDVNIGAGVITCNYDGFQKYRTVIEDGVFVGSDAQLVAPVRIGKGAVVAAGATITKDVPPDALAISRVPQAVREGFASRRRKLKQKKD
ncbi:MAG TPA: bifunctional UDP-N-acetylglucosamine diphosphorylase/glucosamine-1-phosphate N-acetyltransferase GlmU [Nitrospirota bacterium]|nr:bifunctional UDP-N-acetylglucosamine diphosphorylase/glucosamine-1-phosphate N-acetyltransferase GlmU [Nitrospirota bacterium]